MHIDNLGNCVVDMHTGLNCKCFLLKDPQITKLGYIYTNSIFELFDKVDEYRKKCFKNNDLIKLLCDISYVFERYGGNPKDNIELARMQFC